jgi:hypothetical protein
VPLIGQEQDLEVPAPSAVEGLALQPLGEFGALFRCQSDVGRLAHDASPVRVEEMPAYDLRL